MKCPLLFLIFLACALILNSCGKEQPCPKEVNSYDEIPFAFRNPLNSYTGHDTLKFKSEAGIIYTFIGKGLDSGYYINTTTNNCGTVLRVYKRYYGYLFKSSDFSTDLQFLVTVPFNSDFGADLFISAKENNFYLDAMLPPLNHHDYINNLNIDGDIYNNVLKISQNKNYKSIGFLYYNLEAGIIKVFFADSTSLTKTK